MLNIFRKSPKPKTYLLEDIATIWCDHLPLSEPKKEDATSCEGLCTDTESDSEPIFDQIEYRNSSITRFWDQYVRPHIESMRSTPEMIDIIQQLLREFDENGGCCAIDPEDREIPERFHVLENVTLRDHTLSVTRAMIDISRSDDNDFQMIAGRMMIAGLSHDMGLLHRPAFNAGHSFNSAKWLAGKIKELRNGDIIVQAVKYHHLPENQIKIKNPILTVLRTADYKVRQEELDTFLEAYSDKQGSSKEREGVGSDKGFICQEENLFNGIKKAISQDAFECFLFKERIYIRPHVLRTVLSGVCDPQRVSSSKIESLIDPMMGIFSGKFKLHFKDANRKTRSSKILTYFFMNLERAGGLKEFKKSPPPADDNRVLEKIEMQKAKS